jgi:uncharacterized protein YbaP (TraB family)
MRFSFALIVALLVSLNLSAQKSKRPNYKLLWKISGNGLTKPSYLFGTMHAQDKRAFDLNDSVIAKIIQCDAFAMEVHPDSITQFMASIILDEEKRQTIESQMTGPEFLYYDSLMRKKTGLSLKKFNTIKQAKYFIEQRSIKKDKSTFLDAWLYNIARENGKVMAGVEDASVQMKLFQQRDSSELNDLKKYLASDSDADQSLQDLFQIYYEGDVEAIYKFMKSATAEDRFKSLIVDRNKNMTDNIIRQIHQHTLFIAVGAGHLGGDIGIVNLLKQKGYTVDPVTAPFSGTASKYKSKNTGSTGEWFTFSSDDGGYSVEMPQQPAPLAINGLPFKFQTYLDIGTLSVYMSAHIPMGIRVEKDATSKALDKMVANMTASQKVTNVKKITMDGYEGREMETMASGHLFKVKFTIVQANAYMLMVGPSKENANSPDAKRFFSSLKIMKPANAPTGNVVNKEGAFSVDMPGKITTQTTTPTDPNSGKPLKINVYFGTDNNTGAAYIVRYNDFPIGYVSINDSSYVHGTLQAAYQKMAGVDLSVKNIDFHGYPSIQYTFLNAERTAKVDGVLALRGERFYMLMNTHPNNPDTEKASRDFFDSFRFSPFAKPSLKELSFPEGFSLKVPTTFASDSAFSRSDKTNTYSFVDRNSGMMFFVTVESFSKYDQYENNDAFFKSAKEEYKPNMDGEFVKDSTIAAKLPTREYVFQAKDNNAFVRIRSVLAGNSLIALWAYLPSKDGHLTLPDEIFDSFKVTASSDWDLFADKSDLILKGISSTDSTERVEARSALSSYDFKESHLPKLYDALRKSYDDDGKSWGSTRLSLLGKLADTHDNKTLAFIEELYPTLPDTTSLLDKALGVLNSFKTRESVKKATELLVAHKSTHRFASYMVLGTLRDSLQLFNDVAPDILNSLPKFEARNTLFEVVKMAIDSNAFTPERKNEVTSRIMEIATDLANTAPAAPDTDAAYELTSDKYSVTDVLFSVPFTPQVENILRKFLADDSENNKFISMQLLLKNNAAVSVKDINYLASRSSMRLPLYEELVKYNKQSQIDKKYTTDKMLAESEMHEYLFEIEDYYPDKIRFLKEKQVIVNGEKKKIFVFTYAFQDEKEEYLGVAGPYDLKLKEFKRGDVTGTLSGEYKNDKNLNEQLREYLLEYEMKLAD